MVDCFDRIAVQMTELALEPVRMLAERSMLGSVSLRVSSNGRRFSITIAKRFPDQTPNTRYVWLIAELDATGEQTLDGDQSEAAPGTTFDDPETAYWSAVDGLCEINRPR